MEPIPDALQLSVTAHVCPSTVNGWLWYCDVHDTHGNADSQDEAEDISAAHYDHHLALSPDDEDEECDITIWQRVDHERTG